MTVKKRFMLAGTVLACSMLAANVQAAAPRFEIAPFAGYRIGGDFELQDEQGQRLGSLDLSGDTSWGVGVALYRNADSYYELLYSRQTAELEDADTGLGGLDVSTEYLQFGGTLIFDSSSRLRPYVSLTLGLARLNADGFDAEYEPSGSFGLGLRAPVGERVSILLGARAFGTLVGSDTRIACESVGGDATCLVQTSGDLFLQWEASAGIAFTF